MSTAKAPATAALIPDGAVGAWDALARALDGITTACQSEPKAWFDKDTGPAIEACSWCPAKRECFDFAVAANERAGVWGGHSFPLTGGKG